MYNYVPVRKFVPTYNILSLTAIILLIAVLETFPIEITLNKPRGIQK